MELLPSSTEGSMICAQVISSYVLLLCLMPGAFLHKGGVGADRSTLMSRLYVIREF